MRRWLSKILSRGPRAPPLRDPILVGQSGLLDAEWYREAYEDVRNAGADPLAHFLEHGAIEGRNPNPLFDAAWYLAEYPDIRDTGLHPLEHYLQHGAAEGRSPNPIFDPHWYVSAYPEVAAAGLNPLVHYLREGESRGLRPHPLFDPSFYRNEAGLDAGASALAHYLDVGGSAGLPPSADFDPVFYDAQLSREERARFPSSFHHYRAIGRDLELRTARFDAARCEPRWTDAFSQTARALPLVVMIAHPYGGGTEKHIADVANIVSGSVNTALLRPATGGTVVLTLLRPYLHFELAFPRSAICPLVRLLLACGCRRLHIHHVLGLEAWAQDFAASLAVPIDFTVHDYYALSPEPFLTGPDGRFVGEDLAAHEQELLSARTFPHSARSLQDWQAEHAWLLTETGRVIAPSLDAARRIRRYCPAARITVAPHPEPSRQATAPTSAERKPSQPGLLRVAVLGALTPHKGYDVVLACARVARRDKLPLRFSVIGHSSDDAALIDAGVEVTGRYRDADLPALIDEWQGDVIWHPAQCPETYSYTLTASMSSGLPLVVPDLGAFPERVEARPWTWVRPWDASPAEWVSFFVEIRQRHFLTGVPPHMQGLAARVSDRDFYPAEYTGWLRAG